MKSWLTALCAAVFVLVGTGCGNECTDRFDCTNQQGTPPEGKEYACVANKCVTREITCSPACAENQFCEITPGQRVCRTCTAEQGCAEGYTCDPALDNGAGVCLAPAPITSQQIADFLATDAGTLDAPLPIQGAYVTYLKPAANDAGTEKGFFLQAESEGPAMFVSDATALATVKVGDRVNLTVTTKELITGIRAAKAVTGLLKLSENHPVQNLATATPPGLLVDRTGTTDLVTKIGDYESELIALTGTVATDPEFAGGGHSSMRITTTGIPAPIDNFRLRMPASLSTELDLTKECTFTLKGPMWRFNAQAQPSAYSTSDITVATCPAPTVVSAVPPTPTRVLVNFSRQIDPATLTDPATKFTFDNGLTTTAATPNGKQVILTTSNQVAGTTYTVTVANTVKDKRGAAVATPNTATFTSLRPIAVWGGRFLVLGTGFSGATSVKIGDVEQPGFTVDSDTQITIPSVSESTPVGDSKTVVVTTPNGNVDVGTTPVLRLLINEVDANTPGAADDVEFVEIDTGVPNFDLRNTGFSLVLLNGDGDVSYSTTALNATTNAAGLLVVGSPPPVPPAPNPNNWNPDLTFPNANFVQNGTDAVAIYQVVAGAFPNGTAVTANNLIDAMVYGIPTSLDTGLLNALLPEGAARVQVNERTGTMAATAETVSMQRCGRLARRDGRVYTRVEPTVGVANTCPAPAP
ncbi:Ig-like domain-containing protein [Archangium sp.]|uniref:Ig-like domain-containing protein n=1 Tax=Archangium sp. TaxID=1872627 RepID=UPI00286CB3C1|nr:Ig-like domain-containing protein [Archangium sp.]